MSTHVLHPHMHTFTWISTHAHFHTHTFAHMHTHAHIRMQCCFLSEEVLSISHSLRLLSWTYSILTLFLAYAMQGGFRSRPREIPSLIKTVYDSSYLHIDPIDLTKYKVGFAIEQTYITNEQSDLSAIIWKLVCISNYFKC